MRILYVAPRYHTNQVPIIKGLQRMGHQVCFISQYRGNVENYQDIEPIVVGYSRCFLLLDRIYIMLMKKIDQKASDRKIKYGFPPICRLSKAILSFQPDVAILRERSIYSIVSHAICKKNHIPTILYNQTPLWEDRIKNDIAHRLMRVLTPKVRMTPVKGIQKSGSVIEPGARFVPFVMEPEMRSEQRQWSRNNTVHILSIGKYEQRKNHQMLIEVIEETLHKYSIHLTIVGECSNDAHKSYRESLESYINKHKLENVVTLKQNLSSDEVRNQYRKTDLFVIPSTLEPASISQLEAMAFSLPVICSDTNGTACYVESGINGFLFKDNNKDSLRNAIETIISDGELMKKMGEKSYSSIVEKYQIDNYLSVLEELLLDIKGLE